MSIAINGFVTVRQRLSGKAMTLSLLYAPLALSAYLHRVRMKFEAVFNSIESTYTFKE